MAASNTDLFKKGANNFSTTLTGAIVGAGDSSMSLASTTNLPTDTGIVLVIDRVNASGVKTPSLREYVKGVVSGSNVITLVRGVGSSTAQAHANGAVVEYVFDQVTLNDTQAGILTQHNQDGTHAAVTATSIAVSGTSNFTGAVTLPSNTVTTSKISNAQVTADKLATGAQSAVVVTSETTASTTYTDLTTTTDSVTATIGANGLALIIITCDSTNSGTGFGLVSFTASGANTIASSDARAYVYQSPVAGAEAAFSWSYLATGLSAGSTVFKMKYRVTSGTGTFKNRYISVVPL